MKEKIFPILKNTFLVVFLIWIGLLLDGIYNNQKSQDRFIKSQLLCVNLSAKFSSEYGKGSSPLTNEQRRVIANYAGIPVDGVERFCSQLMRFSGTSN